MDQFFENSLSLLRFTAIGTIPLIALNPCGAIFADVCLCAGFDRCLTGDTTEVGLMAFVGKNWYTEKGEPVGVAVDSSFPDAPTPQTVETGRDLDDALKIGRRIL